jgi:hypothetical protein
MLHNTHGPPDKIPGYTYAVITDLGLAIRRGQPIASGSPIYMLNGVGVPASEAQDLFAWALSVYTLIDQNMFGDICDTIFGTEWTEGTDRRRKELIEGLDKKCSGSPILPQRWTFSSERDSRSFSRNTTQPSPKRHDCMQTALHPTVITISAW